MKAFGIILALGLITTSHCAPQAATTATVVEAAYDDYNPTVVRRGDTTPTRTSTVAPESTEVESTESDLILSSRDVGCPILITQKWSSLGGASGKLGAAVGAQINTPKIHQNFAHGAIYCAGSNGPTYAIYGDIYNKWIAIGGGNSAIGYPITDETPSGNHGGRYSDFSNGMIYWHPAHDVYVHTGSLPSTLTYKWDPIKFSGPVGGWVSVVLSSNGNSHWTSNMHASSPLIYKYSIVVGVLSADQQPYTFAHSGSTGPNLGWFGGHKDDGYDKTVFNSEIQKNWRALVAFSHWKGHAKTSLNLLEILNELIDAFKKIYPYVSAAIAIIG